ncbi:MAG: hypothetical protein BWX89_00829 [candidate division TA06 bacterium ADurb.Bin131]|uniref:Putative zinc-finger domain-containing protein n=1 Tax=candidate division TA06 bacterium ADurb.Bin131 TaxID=1852827 RepID=A0A1V6CA26_UNCT6|nr:MAG: hypothetical protein BWX89_00829 [candidate division TA06 bacterium ADurb.Bin131]
MKCEQVKEILSEYLEGIVSEEQKKQIQKHLDICKDCSEYLLLLKNTVNLVNNLPEVCVPPGLASAVMEKIQEKQKRKTRIIPYLTGIAFVEVILLFVIIPLKKPYQTEITQKIQQKPSQQVQKIENNLIEKEKKETTIAYQKKSKVAQVPLEKLETGSLEKEKKEIIVQIACRPLPAAVSEKRDIEKEKNILRKESVEQDKPQSEIQKSLALSRPTQIVNEVVQQATNVESEIKKHITSVNGKILSEQIAPDTEITYAITAEIPYSAYKTLIEGLEERFQIKNMPLLQDIYTSDTEIKIKIEVFR